MMDIQYASVPCKAHIRHKTVPEHNTRKCNNIITLFPDHNTLLYNYVYMLITWSHGHSLIIHRNAYFICAVRFDPSFV